MIPLTVHSFYSLMWGTASPLEICRAARRMGYRQLALTDTDNLYGLWPFLRACRQTGIRPIIGAELTDPGKRSRRAVCLVKNDRGYSQLCRLITRRHLDTGFDLNAALAEHGRDLFILTGCPNLMTILHQANISVAAAIPRRPLPASHPIRKTAADLGIAIAATPDSFFLNPKDITIHHLLRAIDCNTTVTRLEPGDCAPDDAWLASPDTYAQRFAICPKAVHATSIIAADISFCGPEFGIVMPPLHNSDDPDRALRKAAYEGAKRRYGTELPEPVVDRLEQELAIIADMNFSAYFLIVRDIVQNSPRTCGRGSGAASLVAYSLGITNVCPVKHNLYFGRFLNPGRSDPPDIDVDFAWDERDAVLKTVLREHDDHAAMVCNHVCFKPRMAVRETAKVYGLTEGETGRVARKLPRFYWDADPGDQLDPDRLQQRPESKDLQLPPPWPEILELSRRLVGIPRYLSVHPGGVVITPRPIREYVPVEKAPKGVPIIQWEKDSAEEAGLVKIDLLGNRSLGVIRDAMANVQANGIPFDEPAWEPEDDPATQRSVAAGQTMGCFYIESPAMRLLQQKTGVGDFEHLVIHSSIIRPAANEFIQEYIRRLHGGAWDPVHPRLADVLNETYGIMVYQEDVSRAAVALAGFSDAEADGLRKILSKKDREHEMRDFRDRFISGARPRGVSDAAIATVWNMMMSFCGYSFCKPHSASYARVSFQAAYLKAHHPAEFMSAVISNQGGFYSTFAYVSEARRMGLSVLPPDINHSRVAWRGAGQTMRVGFLSVKGLGKTTRDRIVAEQSRPYDSFIDFMTRVRPDEDEARALILCGALDCLNSQKSRPSLLWQLAQWRKQAKQSAGGLFRSVNGDAGPPPPRFPPDNPIERLRREFAVLGFLCAHHPMALYRDQLNRQEVLPAARLSEFTGKRIRMAGWLVTGKVVSTKTGEPMEFLTFEDETGIVETTFFPKTYHRFCHMIDRGRPYLLTGRVEKNWGVATLNVDGVVRLGLPL